MASSNATSTTVWAIEHLATKERLGCRDRMSDAGLDFGGRVPVFYSSLRHAREAWMKYSQAEEYITRGISLPGVGKIFHPGPNFAHWPKVRFVKIDLAVLAFEIATLEELRVVKKNKR